MIVGVQDVMRGAGMLGISREHPLGDRARLPPQRQRRIASRQRRKQRQSIKRLRVIVGRICGGDRRHDLRVGGRASGLITGTE